GDAVPPCAPDGYTSWTPYIDPGSGLLAYSTTPVVGGGWARLQDISGNPLPNSPKNKIALNATYDIRMDAGTLTPSVSYIWRGAQFGTLFNRPWDRAPSWSQVDGRV